MATLSMLVKGQTLWDISKKGGKIESWPVKVLEINLAGGYIMATWNGNRKPMRFCGEALRKLRVRRPE